MLRLGFSKCEGSRVQEGVEVTPPTPSFLEACKNMSPTIVRNEKVPFSKRSSAAFQSHNWNKLTCLATVALRSGTRSLEAPWL